MELIEAGYQASGTDGLATAGDVAGSQASRRRPSLLGRLREDVQAVLARDPSATSARDVVLFATGLHAVWSYRRNHWLWEHGARRLATYLSQRTRRRLGVEIHPAATIGRRLVIDHGMGVVIGATAVIGDDVMLYQGVTLGMTGKHAGKRHPTLGNNVMVGARATILGDIRIGDNSKVGAGAVVLHDVPDDVTVAGVPASVVREHRCWEAGCLSLVPDVAAQADDENLRWSCSL